MFEYIIWGKPIFQRATSHYCFCTINANVNTIKKEITFYSYYPKSFGLIDFLKGSQGNPGVHGPLVSRTLLIILLVIYFQRKQNQRERAWKLGYLYKHILTIEFYFLSYFFKCYFYLYYEYFQIITRETGIVNPRMPYFNWN